MSTIPTPTSDEVTLKIWCLDLAQGDLKKAQDIFKWLNPQEAVVPLAAIQKALRTVREAQGVPRRHKEIVFNAMRTAGVEEWAEIA